MTTKAYSYIVDEESYDSIETCGGYSQVYFIKNRKTLVFKEFRTKKIAQKAYTNQQKLSRYNLAPYVKSKVFQLQYKTTTGYKFKTNFGFLSEKAIHCNELKLNPYVLQNLVENIYYNTGLEFWDCHAGNVGYIIRRSKRLLVCIDTGWESFDKKSNQWGNRLPGPICPDCKIPFCLCYE